MQTNWASCEPTDSRRSGRRARGKIIDQAKDNYMDLLKLVVILQCVGWYEGLGRLGAEKIGLSG